MPKKCEAPAQGDDVAELRREIANLKDHVRLLVETLDRIHDELTWITRNGLPFQGPLPRAPEPHMSSVPPLVVQSAAMPECTSPKPSAPAAPPPLNAAATADAGKGRLY